MQIHYEIKEEVIDKRGTSDGKETTTILTSKKQVFKSPNRLVEASFTLPKNQPATTQAGDARIYWQLVVKVWTIMNFQFTYKTEFTVTKERLLS